MAIARVSAQDATNTGVATVTATYPTTPTAGNLLICGCATDSGGGAGAMSSPGWTVIFDSLAVSPTTCLSLYYKRAGASEPTTVSLADGSATEMCVAIYEYSGFTGTPTVDRTVSASAFSGASSLASGTTSLTRYSNELLFALVEYRSTTFTSWSGGLTTRNTVTKPTTRLTTGDLVVSNQGNYTTTATIGASSSMIVGLATIYDSIPYNPIHYYSRQGFQ